jgi:hypothetical protein
MKITFRIKPNLGVAGRPTHGPITGNNEEIVVVTLVRIGQSGDQFNIYIFGSKMARSCQVRARTGVGINK